MRRPVGLLLLAAFSVSVAAQDARIAIPEQGLTTIIELLDAMAIAEGVVLSDEPISAEEFDALLELVDVAEVIGAEDLAARARTLVAIAKGPRRRPQRQNTLDDPLGLSPDRTVSRGDNAFSGLLTGLSVAGGVTLVLSGVFYALAERDYREWSETTDEALRDELASSWRGYEILSLGTGGVSLLTLGVGIPLTFAISGPEDGTGVPPSRELYTPEERELQLATLYSERASIVTEINALRDTQARRTTITTVGVSTGVVGSLASAAFFLLAEQRYQEYVRAPFSDDASRLRWQVQLFDALGVVSGIAALSGFSTAAVVEFGTDSRRELQEQLTRVNESIIELRTENLMSLEPEEDEGGRP